MRDLAAQIELLAGERAHHGAAARRERVGQGARRRADSRAQPTRSDAVRRGQLCRADARGARGRAVRSGRRRRTTATSRTSGCSRSRLAGSLFLDEIGELGTHLQAQLLRVFEGKGVPARRRHAGDLVRRADHRGDEPRPRDRGERRAVPGGSVLSAQRHAAVPAAAARAVARGSRRAHRANRRRAASAPAGGTAWRSATRHSTGCSRHAWPGNIRELRNVLERCDDRRARIGADRIAASACGGARSIGTAAEPHIPRTLEDVERVHIDRTLRAHASNRTHAARELGISRATLIKKIKEYGLNPRAR